MRSPALYISLSKRTDQAFAQTLVRGQIRTNGRAQYPQLALFNEPESDPLLAVEDVEEEVVTSTSRRGKRKPLSAELPRIEVIHELPEHEPTGVCGCRKHVIGEETNEQRVIVPMQIRVIKHIRKVYGAGGSPRHR